MKWIKIAIGAVIAIFSISVITTTVYKMTQPTEVIKEVSIEIDYNEGTYSPISTFNDIEKYSILDNNLVLNVSIYIDNEIAHNIDMYLFSPYNLTLIGPLPDSSGYIDCTIEYDGSVIIEGGTWTHDMVIKFAFEVSQPPQLTGTNATLILLIPIVFIGGVLLYFYKPLKKE